MNDSNRMLRRLAMGAVVFSLVLAACSTPGAGGSGEPKGTVNLAINPWVGYEANAAVVAYLLEKELGYTVEKKALKEDVSWQGFETGEVDVIIENWGHPDLEKKYIDEDKVALVAGETGNVGIIGWYVPHWMVEEYPDILDHKNLNKYAELFKTSESGDLGQFLGSDPSFVQYDEALVKNLGLDFKVIFSGGEAASIKAFQTATEQKTPLIGYFYDPQWLHAQITIDQVKLPAYEAGCDADLEKVACDYPPYALNKIVSKKFADTGGAAYELIKNFKWTNADQNKVSDLITNDFAADPATAADKAAEQWVKENEAIWKAWIPAS